MIKDKTAPPQKKSPEVSPPFISKIQKDFRQQWTAFQRRLAREWEQISCYLREYLSVKQAAKRHEAGANFFLLRRNIHRLEKGLLHQPVQKPFAQDYLAETVRCYRELFTRAGAEWTDSEDLVWARDVLTQYFKVTPLTPPLKNQKAIFETLEEGIIFPASEKQVPFPYKHLEGQPVSYEDLLQLMKHRHSVRNFLPKPVPRELLDRAVEAARCAPSACNRQPFEFRIYDEPSLVKKIAAIPMGTAGFDHTFQSIILVVGNLDAFFHERDRHLIYIDGSLAAMSLMLALEALGLASCPINWPDMESKEKEMAAAVPLAAGEKIVMLVAAGYPDPEALIAYSRKKSVPELRTFNKTE